MSEDIDSIIAEAEGSTNTETPMTAPETTEAQTPQQTPVQEFEFSANGQNIKVPYGDQRVKRWLEMGYSAPQTISRFQQELQTRDSRIKEYDAKFKDYETKYKPYQEIDTWAKANPQAWQTLEANWRQQLQGMTPNQIAQLPPEQKQKLELIEQKFQQLEQKEQIQREQAADHSLETEIQSIRKSNPNIDFGHPQDPNSLEMQVLRHGIQNGIPSFRAAFRDYFHDQQVQMAQEKGRENAGKALQKTRNLGLPGSPAPKPRAKTQDLRNLSYEQINELALQELGIG